MGAAGGWRGPPGHQSLPEEDFCILKANGLSRNGRKSRDSSGVQAEGRRVGRKVGGQRIPKILIVGASLHARGRQTPRVGEGLAGRA